MKRIVSLVILAISTGAVEALDKIPRNVHASKTATLKTASAKEAMEQAAKPVTRGPEFLAETQDILKGMSEEVGNTCVADVKDVRPDTNNSLIKVNGEIHELIKQYGQIMVEENAELNDPIALGPPETMKLAMDPSMQGLLTKYLYLKHPPKQSRLPANREQLIKDIEESIRKKFPNAKIAIGTSEIYKAALLASKISSVRNSNRTLKGGGRVYESLAGVQGNEKFFESLSSSRHSIPKMEKYLVELQDRKETEEFIVKTVVAGLATGGFTAASIGWRSFINKNVRGLNVGASAGAAATITATGSLWSMISNEFGSFFSGQLKSETIKKIQDALVESNKKSIETIEGASAAGLLLDEADKFVDAMGAAPSGEGGEAPKHAEPSLGVGAPAILATKPIPSETFSIDPKKVMFVKTADAFADSMFQIRSATTAILQNPGLMDSGNLKSFSGSTAAANLAFSDMREANSKLTTSLRNFDDAGVQLEAVTKDTYAMTSDKAKGKSVNSSRLANGEFFFQSMLSGLDTTVGLLSDQRRNFDELKTGVQNACDADQLKIYESWNKNLPFSGGWMHVEGAFLAQAVLARSDCVYKKSLIRSAELLKIAQTISHLKGTCTQIKTWDKGVRLLPKLKARILQ